MTEAGVIIIGRLSGIASLLALLINWGWVVFLSRQYDPASIRIWGPLDTHPAAVLAVVMIAGAAFGIFAG